MTVPDPELVVLQEIWGMLGPDAQRMLLAVAQRLQQSPQQRTGLLVDEVIHASFGELARVVRNTTVGGKT